MSNIRIIRQDKKMLIFYSFFLIIKKKKFKYILKTNHIFTKALFFIKAVRNYVNLSKLIWLDYDKED